MKREQMVLILAEKDQPYPGILLYGKTKRATNLLWFSLIAKKAI